MRSRSSTPPVSLQKKKAITKEHRQSAIQEAIKEQNDGRAQGLMKFLKPCTPEELRAQLQVVEVKLDDGWQQAAEFRAMTDERRWMSVREGNKERQRKYRQKIRDIEVIQGE